MGSLADCRVIVRTGGRLAEGRLAWHEGARGRMLPSVIVGLQELGPASVEVLEAGDERTEALVAAG